MNAECFYPFFPSIWLFPCISGSSCSLDYLQISSSPFFFFFYKSWKEGLNYIDRVVQLATNACVECLYRPHKWTFFLYYVLLYINTPDCPGLSMRFLFFKACSCSKPSVAEVLWMSELWMNRCPAVFLDRERVNLPL